VDIFASLVARRSEFVSMAGFCGGHRSISIWRGGRFSNRRVCSAWVCARDPGPKWRYPGRWLRAPVFRAAGKSGGVLSSGL